MLTFISFAIIFVVIFYGIGGIWGDHKERIKRRDESMAKGRVDYDYNGKLYVGNRRAYLLKINERDVLVDANNPNEILYDLTTREEARLRQEYLRKEKIAIEEAKSKGLTWIYIPNYGRATNEPWMQKDIETGQLFIACKLQYVSSYWITYYKLLNPVGIDRLEYVEDKSIPARELSEKEYMDLMYPKSKN